jgi:UDP-N-acetylmuramate dehydrogenase
VHQLYDVPLATLTTLRLGGPACRLVEAATAQDVVEAVREADRRGEPVLVLGGGSNLVVADAGFPGTVVRIVSRGVSIEGRGDRVRAVVAAGEPWDAVVTRVVTEGLAGIECLAGIPGLTGATPVQNVGAYGQEVADTITAVRVYDRKEDAVRTLAPAECGFSYRHSVLKGQDRFVILEVSFALTRSPLSRPIRYAELARSLGAAPGGTVPLAEARTAVLALRRGKGMVLDGDDPDTWSAGSFFTNPVLDPAAAAALPDGAPRYPQPDGRVKTSAAWLIERAGVGRGFGRGAVRVSGKHSLALTNRGGATTEELVMLAREVRAAVRQAFDVDLVNEPVLVGCTL